MNDVLSRLRTSLQGRYTVDREIGRGGMSLVFLARDLKHDRNVAVKVLRPELTASIGAKRFLSEIRIAANLEHPNILPLFDSGEADGLLYYSMPLVEGESLRDRIEREGALPLDEALLIAKEVGEALAYAHEQGVVHRDIKPENILVASSKARVADFGIACARTEAGDFESIMDAYMAVGTPEYMSPEQGGGSDTLDERTDIYSLGCVLYGMLAGEPPFSGRTPQAVIAKHQSEKIPSISVVRPDIPPRIAKIVEKALAKVPADRYATATKLVDALERAPRRGDKVPVVTAAVAAVVVTAGAIGLWNVVTGPDPIPLNREWVVGFPLPTMGLDSLSADIGQIAALRLGTALEGTDPLIWKWGWDWLTPAQRQDPGLVNAPTMDSITRARGARFRINGSLVQAGNEASVTLFLHDVLLDSMLVQRTTRSHAHPDSVLPLVLRAGRGLLPALLEPGREVDFTAFENRDLAATALWMQGEVEYRSSRFSDALGFYERAVARDSTLAMAALKGAQAASWNHEIHTSQDLVAAALVHDSVLPTRHLSFARGLQAYLHGNADSAVHWSSLALAEDPAWAEAYVLLGEVYYHLLPAGFALDSLAEEMFASGYEIDDGFTPALFHLAEIGIRKEDIDRASALIETYRGFMPETNLLGQLDIMLDCVRQGPQGVDWDAAAFAAPLETLSAAKSLAVGGSHLECAEQGYRAVMRNERAQLLHWGAVLGLQGVLFASGNREEYVALIDSVITYRPPTMTLFLLGAIADSSLTSRAIEAEEFIRNAFGNEYERSPSANLLWTMAVWHAHRGDRALVRSLRETLAAQSHDRQSRLFAASLSGLLAFLEGDTSLAISTLESLSSTARRDSLDWQVGESLPCERLLLARLLVQRGLYEDAIRVASVFDHPGPIIFPKFLPASLAIRYEAANGLRSMDLADMYRERLISLGRDDILGAERP